MRRLRSLLRCTAGAAAAEMLLILPFMTALLFGSVEVGYYFYCEHQVMKGLRDGARYASRLSFTDMRCTGTTPTLSGTAQTAIQEVTRTGRTSGGTARVPGWTNAQTFVTLSCVNQQTGIYKNEDSTPQVTVRADVPFTPLFGAFGILSSGVSLKARQQSAVMGI